FDDVGAEQGVLATHQMTDDTTPRVRVSLTGSAAGREAVQVGDTVRLIVLGSTQGQAMVTADDLSHGYIDVQMAAGFTQYSMLIEAEVVDQAGNRSGSGAPFWLDFAPSSGVSRTNLTDGGYTLDYREGAPYYDTHVQRYDAAGHAVGPEVERDTSFSG